MKQLVSLPFLGAYLAFALLLTLVFGSIYATVQQNYRQSANDPQIQIAEDAVSFLSGGGQMQDIINVYPKVNFAESFAPFIVIYDAQGKVISSSGNMDGIVPTPPIGALYAALYGENRVTWQPRKDVRIAAVIVPSYNTIPNGGTFENNGGKFILAGRNLREVEIREERLELMVAFGWIGSLILLAIGLYFLKRKN